MTAIGQVKVWESMGAYLAECREHGERPNAHGTGNDYHWDNGVNYRHALTLAETGDDRLVAQATKALERVESITAALPQVGWTRHIQGARVDVPAYLAGSPSCFKRRMKRERDVRHVRIFVNAMCSGGVSADKMLQRGVTILGLVEALLAAQVHVELYVTCDGVAHKGPNDNQVVAHAIKLDEPINLSVQGFCLAHPAFARHPMYSMYYHVGGAHGPGLSSRADVKDIRKAYNMSPEDVYVPWCMYGDDVNEAWLQKHINQLVGGGEKGEGY